MRRFAILIVLVLAVPHRGRLFAQVQSPPPAAADLASAYARALSYRDFRGRDTTRAARWAAADAQAPRTVSDVLGGSPKPAGAWRVLVVADLACSDSPEALPYLARLAEQVPGVELRVLRRADGLALLNTHLLNGHTATPLVIVMDTTFRERGVWHERATHIQQYVTANEGKIPFDELAAHVRALRRDDAGRTPLREVLALMHPAAP